jgi:hypothetical protein
VIAGGTYFYCHERKSVAVSGPFVNVPEIGIVP